MNKIIGAGNALVDVILQLENDKLLDEFKLPKGGMELIDSSTKKKILNKTTALSKQYSSGGSAANTIHGLANLGLDTGFIGSVGNDATAEFFVEDLKKNGIEPKIFYRNTETGSALTFVSRDSERTFATFLGAAIELSPDDIDSQILNAYSWCHIEGYLVNDTALIKKIAETAQKSGLQVSLDLASYNVVEANLDFLRNLTEKSIDIVFANEDEAKAFSGMENRKALEYISKLCEIAVVKTGKKGSMIQSGKKYYSVEALNVNCIDTTGAGDLYAAGFIYGLVMGYSMENCGKTGTLLAGNVIQNIGAKLSTDQWNNLHETIKYT